MINNKIKQLREEAHLSQHQLAQRLGVSRTSVSAWELGLVQPTIPFVVEMATLFNTSSDYILGLQSEHSINSDGLTNKEIEMITELVNHLKDLKQSSSI